MVADFTCEQCLQKFAVLRKIIRYSECGFMCDDCWSKFRKRVQQVFFNERKK
jgi:predicted nucleic acid-binding Zn ribbon protein